MLLKALLLLFLLSLALKHEKRVDLVDNVGLKDAYSIIERVRRVAWPTAVLAAFVLSFLLQEMLHISIFYTLSTSFVVLQSMLNYRAYHLHDEFKKVLVLVE